MKKTIKVLLMSIVLFLCLVGCSSTSKLIGTWTGMNSFTFNKDGTGTISFGENVINEFKYKVSDDVITLIYEGDGFGQAEDYRYRFEDGKLYLNTDNSNSWSIYEKVVTNDKGSTTSSEVVELTSDSLKELVLNTQSADDWMIGGNSHVDWNTWADIDGCDFYKIISDDMQCTEDVYNFISNCYTASIVEAFRNSNIIIDYEGSIYSNTGGIGGIPSHVKTVKAVKDGNNYSVTLFFDDPYDMGTGEYEQSITLIPEDGKYVFSEGLHSIMDDFTDCEFIVE